MGGEGLKENVLKENFWVGGEGKVVVLLLIPSRLVIEHFTDICGVKECI